MHMTVGLLGIERRGEREREREREGEGKRERIQILFLSIKETMKVTL